MGTQSSAADAAEPSADEKQVRLRGAATAPSAMALDEAAADVAVRAPPAGGDT